LRVLLINPYYPISETPSPPLGLAFLAGALEQAGHHINILDCVVFPYRRDYLESTLRDLKPELVGATAVTMTVDHALDALEAVKSLDPSITTVIGGPHATFCATDILQSCNQVLDKMHQAGCTTVSFGVESGSPEMLRRIKKGITIAQVVHAMQLCLDCGIDPHASFILGLPGETETTLAQTFAFGERLKAMGVSHGFHILAPFPGTDVREHVDEYDLQILSDDWRRYHANRAIIRTARVQPETMDAVVIDGERQFDQWLEAIGRNRDEGRATTEESWPLVRLEHTVVIYDMMMKGLIEEKGRWPIQQSDKADANPTAELIRRLFGELDHPPERIRAAIVFAAAKRYLTRNTADGRINWSWVDYI
jgi:radical SAM superfamily enzyme YgiQ (UPF0313 family)